MATHHQDQYDILITVSLRAWDGTAREPFQEDHVTIGMIDYLAGWDGTVDESLKIARKWLEEVAPTMLVGLGACALRMRHEQPVLPFP